MHYSKLREIISNHISLEQQDFDLIASFFKFETAKKRTSLIKAGKPADKLFFVISGYLKYFKILDSAEELIIHLFTPNTFATSLNGFFLGKKSEETLQTITDCEYLYITNSDMEKLYSTDCKWLILGRKLLEMILIEREQSFIDHLSLTAYDNYLKLMQNQPDIIQNVPGKYIASFLGIQPESLSRIRKIN